MSSSSNGGSHITSSKLRNNKLDIIKNFLVIQHSEIVFVHFSYFLSLFEYELFLFLNIMLNFFKKQVCCLLLLSLHCLQGLQKRFYVLRLANLKSKVFAFIENIPIRIKIMHNLREPSLSFFALSDGTGIGKVEWLLSLVEV